MFEKFSIDYQSMLFDYERIPFAVAAILLVMLLGVVTGPLAGNANPFYWQVIDILFGKAGDRLDRRHRARGTLLIRGLIITALVITISYYVAHGVETLLARYNLNGFYQSLFVALCITAGSIWFALLRLYRALGKKQVAQGAYYAISHSTRVNLATVDDFGITRTGMNFAARSFDKGMIAPLFWYLVAGLPALFIYTGIAALNWRFGKCGFTKGFGDIPLLLERILGFVPSLITAVLFTLASLFTPKAKLHKGLASWLAIKGRSPYPQGGFPLTSLAWALNLSLGGPEQDITGSAIQSRWTGPEMASAKIEPNRLRQGIYIHVIAHLLLIGGLLALYLWAKGGIPHLLSLWPF